MFPFTKFLLNTSGRWQSAGLYLDTEESNSTSLAATKVNVPFACVAAAGRVDVIKYPH